MRHGVVAFDMRALDTVDARLKLRDHAFRAKRGIARSVNSPLGRAKLELNQKQS
jgi:hypothetical protein